MPELDGLRVLNTRPAGRADELCRALSAAGARVMALPLLEIEAVTPPPGIGHLALELDRYRAVFVVSPVAATLGLRWLGECWPQWPAAVQWLAVGEATAAVLRDAGLAPLVPAHETSEGLLALPALRELSAGDRLLVLRGEGGRNLVRDTLRDRGVRVDYADLYRRHLPAAALAQWRELVADGLPDVAIITSGETLRHWVALAGADAARIPCLVVSPRLAEQAGSLGCPRVITAAGMAPGAIVTALATWRGTTKHDID